MRLILREELQSVITNKLKNLEKHEIEDAELAAILADKIRDYMEDAIIAENSIKCNECGDEVGFDFITPTKSFMVSESGVERTDNNISDKPFVKFSCMNDSEHTWIRTDDPLYILWAEAIKSKFNREQRHKGRIQWK